MGGQPGEAECWEPRDEVPYHSSSTDLGKTEVSGNLVRTVQWSGGQGSPPGGVWENGSEGGETETFHRDSS